MDLAPLFLESCFIVREVLKKLDCTLSPTPPKFHTAVVSLRFFGSGGALAGKELRVEAGALLGTRATLLQGTLGFLGNSFDV